MIGGYWIPVRDGDDRARGLYRRHYSARRYGDGRRPMKFVGPGEYIVLLGADSRALFVWRKFISGDGQAGVCCAAFRLEESAKCRASDLILEAEEWARLKWPNERFYTYVNPHKVRSTNPGWSFQCAGWEKVGYSKRGLIILAKKLYVRAVRDGEQIAVFALHPEEAP